MGPKGYPACVLFYFAIVMSFLATGRVALRARDFARTRIVLCWKSPALESRRFEPNIPSLPSSDWGIKVSLAQVNDAEISAQRGGRTIYDALQPVATPLPPPADHSAPADFLCAHHF